MNQRAEFIEEVKSQYDPKEGKRVESGGRSTVLPAHISDLGVERSIAMFGSSDKMRRWFGFNVYWSGGHSGCVWMGNDIVWHTGD
ncbi:hypothetical protein BWX42_00520 [Dolosigranulum pigrum]|uniref:Uncharacterized protein n=1 Tax=Dolosigranulum pigrum TaxID=29394 RepID=A0A1S8KL38_9LACT|nr:hypothetical protein BWX42_00520 [Dolosigranulum pigrum]